jgi:hypothetical protein
VHVAAPTDVRWLSQPHEVVERSPRAFDVVKAKA